jgi:hypothetical protein
MEINRDWAHLEFEFRLPAGISKHTLRPGGWLIAVMAEIDTTLPAWGEGQREKYESEVEITDYSGGQALYGKFTIRHGIGYYKGGIVFDEPLPNMDTANPYILETREFTPPLIVHSLGCWPAP